METTKKQEKAAEDIKRQQAAQAEKAAAKQAKHISKGKPRKGGLDGNGAPAPISIGKAAEAVVVSPKRATVADLPPVIRSAKKLAEENVARIEQAAGFRDWMAVTLPRMDEYMAADASTQAQMKGEVEMARQYLYGILDHQDPVIQREAWMTMLRYRLGQTFKTHQAAGEMFERMAAQDLLIPTNVPDAKALLPGGMNTKYGKPNSIYGVTYNLPAGVPLADKDVVELRKLYNDFRNRTMEGVKQTRRERAAVLATKATITLEQCLDHVPGIVLFEVGPAEIADKDGDGNGGAKKKNFYQGGTLLMQSDGNRLYIVDVINEPGNGGMGTFETNIREAMAMRPEPFLLIDPTFKLVPAKIEVGNLSWELKGKILMLSHVVIRAIRAHFGVAKKIDQEVLAAAAPAVAEEATVPTEGDSEDETIPAHVNHDPKGLGVEGAGLVAAAKAKAVAQTSSTPEPAATVAK